MLLDYLVSFEFLNVLFEVIRLLRLISVLSKWVSVAELTCCNFAAKFSAVYLLNSGVVVIYLSWLGILFSTSLVFVLRT